MSSRLGLCSIILIVYQTVGMHVQQRRNYIVFDRDDTEKEVSDYIRNKGYLPSDDQLFAEHSNTNTGNDATFRLSKLSDEELLRLLNDQPNINNYNFNDLVNVAFDKKEASPDNSGLSHISSKVLLNSPIDPRNGEITMSSYSDVSNNAVLKQLLNYKPQYSESSTNKRFETVGSLPLDPESNGYFRLEHKQIDSGNVNSDSGTGFNALQRLNNIVYNHPTTLDNDRSEHNTDDGDVIDEDRKEMLFDILVAQLKSLCCSRKEKPNVRKTKKVVFNIDADADVPAEILKIAKKNIELRGYVPQQQTEIKNNYEAELKEQMFLIMNDELKSNETDELISVDPDSLDKNSSVLLLGPIASPLSDAQLKVVMSRITTELSDPEYFPLLQQLSDGTLSGRNTGLLKNIISGPQTRKYIKPHRCNHQSKLSKVYGGPKWLICSGYLNINGPSLYD